MSRFRNKTQNILDDRTCLLWAKMPQFQQRLARTRANVENMLEICRNPYVSFSAGKDSSVLADIVLQIDSKIPLRMVTSGETRLMFNVDEVVQWFRERRNAEVEELFFDRFSGQWKGTFEEHDIAVKRDLKGIDNRDYDGVFLGLRKEENRGRKISLSQCKTEGIPPNMYRYKSGREYYRMCPLSDWKTEDIGAYIVSNQIPILDWYTKFGYESRTTLHLINESFRRNTLYWLKVSNPEGYYLLLERFPELAVITN